MAFIKAEVWRMQILAVSMVLFIAIAIFLAFCTSQAIAHPIKAATKIAKRVIQETNFKILVPVTTQDEIGLLTTSLNQLI